MFQLNLQFHEYSFLTFIRRILTFTFVYKLIDLIPCSDFGLQEHVSLYGLYFVDLILIFQEGIKIYIYICIY